ncbi:MAG TPA: hypothetical protein VK155_09170 [Bacteroidales bacterium]|jgi:hypothetical protein|nr:hypothetical protein [Bacteroidales bacterium]
MKKEMLSEDEIVHSVAKVLDQIINKNKKTILKDDFWVYPGFGWGFHLNQLSTFGLPSLIDHILFDTGVYKKILTKKQYAQCMYVISEKPGEYYYPIHGHLEDKKLDEILMWVHWRCVVYVAHRLVKLGVDIKDYFDEFEDIDFTKESGL